MHFTYNKEAYCLNLDWLSFSVHTAQIDPTIECPEGLRIEVCQGNNIFQNRALVFDGRGAKYLTLLWKPYSKVLPANLMTVQVANEFLYFAGGMGIKWAFEDVQRITECTFNAVSRVDLCIDFQASPTRLEFLKHLNSGHYYAQHKSEGATWWHEDGGSHHKQLHCLNWGSPKSEIKVKIYNKSREQGLVGGTEPDKPWIVSEWKEVNFDISKVWRLEFSLSGAGQLRYKGKPITLENLRDSQWILDVFLDMYCHRFITRINQNRRSGHKNEDTRVMLLDLPARPNILKWAEPKGDVYAVPAAITLLRAMMRQIDNPAILAHRPTFEDYANTVLNIIDTHHLGGYFKRTYEANPDEYFSELYQSVGQGLRTAPASPARLMD